MIVKLPFGLKPVSGDNFFVEIRSSQLPAKIARKFLNHHEYNSRPRKPLDDGCV